MMKRIIFCFIILLPLPVPVAARTIELTLQTPKVSKPVKKYAPLPKVENLTDSDAAPLYEKALESLPSDLPMDEIEQWLKMPTNELPLNQVRSTLEQLEPILKLHEQAAKCKQCYWPYWDEDVQMENFRKHRRIIFFHALKIRLRIAQGRYDDAIGTAQTGFAMAKHLGGGPTLIHGMIGISIAGYTSQQLSVFIQHPDAPNLYQALRDLPQPFIDLTELAQWEDPKLKNRIHQLMNRLDRHIAILQCIEAMRLYAGAHEGQFPKQLSEIQLVSIPDDPVTGKPFVYSRTGSKAVLEGPAPKGATDKDAIRYELNLKE